jgi:SAM-dependent methyltransferase
VGCGTGRLLLTYLAEGIDIDGLDVSPEMLAVCRTKANRAQLDPHLYQQEMATMALPRRYRTILVPSSSFQLVINPAQTDQAMRRFYAHLYPGGLLVMPFIVLGEPYAVIEQEARRPEDGALVRRRTVSRYDRLTQLEDTEDTYEVIVGEQVLASEHHVRSPAARGYSASQARALYEAAGFRVIRVVSGFTQREYMAGDSIFTVVGLRPA